MLFSNTYRGRTLLIIEGAAFAGSRWKASGEPGIALNTSSEKVSVKKKKKKSLTVLNRSTLEILSSSGRLSIKR